MRAAVQTIAPDGQFTSAFGYSGKIAASAGFMMSRYKWLCARPLSVSTCEAYIAGIWL